MVVPGEFTNLWEQGSKSFRMLPFCDVAIHCKRGTVSHLFFYEAQNEGHTAVILHLIVHVRIDMLCEPSAGLL